MNTLKNVYSKYSTGVIKILKKLGMTIYFSPSFGVARGIEGVEGRVFDFTLESPFDFIECTITKIIHLEGESWGGIRYKVLVNNQPFEYSDSYRNGEKGKLPTAESIIYALLSDSRVGEDYPPAMGFAGNLESLESFMNDFGYESMTKAASILEDCHDINKRFCGTLKESEFEQLTEYYQDY